MSGRKLTMRVTPDLAQVAAAEARTRREAEKYREAAEAFRAASEALASIWVGDGKDAFEAQINEAGKHHAELSELACAGCKSVQQMLSNFEREEERIIELIMSNTGENGAVRELKIPSLNEYRSVLRESASNLRHAMWLVADFSKGWDDEAEAMLRANVGAAWDKLAEIAEVGVQIVNLLSGEAAGEGTDPMADPMKPFGDADGQARLIPQALYVALLDCENQDSFFKIAYCKFAEVYRAESMARGGETAAALWNRFALLYGDISAARQGAKAGVERLKALPELKAMEPQS